MLDPATENQMKKDGILAAHVFEIAVADPLNIDTDTVIRVLKTRYGQDYPGFLEVRSAFDFLEREGMLEKYRKSIGPGNTGCSYYRLQSRAYFCAALLHLD